MTIGAVSTLVFSNQSSTDLKTLQNQLVALQAQVASGYKSTDLAGYGGVSQQILSVRGLIAQTQATADVATNLDARFTTIDQSLGAAYNAGEALRQAVLNAIGNGDGSSLATALQTAFSTARTALNTTYQGEALFGGARADGTPINVSSLSDLEAAPSTASIFDESASAKTVDLGQGPVTVSPTASSVSSGLFDAMRTLQQTLTAAGGSLGSPLTDAQISALQGVATALSAAGSTLTTAQGQNGATQNSVSAQATALNNQVDTLTKVAGDSADADLASVATQISTLQTQYQALAQTYSQLSKLSLVNFLTTTL